MSDLIIVATFESISLSRVIQGDAPQDVVGYAAATVRVDRVLAGAMPDDLVIEFLLPTTAESLTAAGLRAQAESLAIDLPNDRMVLFLHEKLGAGEAGLYRLVESRGLWVEGPDRYPVAPLDSDIETETNPLMDASSVRSLDDLIAAVKS